MHTIKGAARSANAAKETTDMIEGSIKIKKAEDGTKITRDTAGALNRIVNGIEKVLIPRRNGWGIFFS